MHDFILIEPKNSKRKKYYINPVVFNSEKKSSNTKTKPNINIYTTMKTTFSATTLFAILSFAASIQAQAPGAPPAAAPSGDASGSAPASPSGGGGDAGGAGGAGAGPVQITQPLQGATWKIGSQETITWQPTQQDVTDLIVNLMKGDPSALQLVQALATSVDASKGSTNITVPKNATEGSDYSIAVGKDQSQMAYIGGITISKTASSSASASGAAPAPTSSGDAAGGDAAGGDASAGGAPGGDAAASSAPAAGGGGGGDGAAAPPMGKRAEPDASASGDAAGGASASVAPSGDASSAPSGAASGAASASSSGAEASSSETSGASATKIMSGFAISLAGAALAMTGF